MKKREDPLGSRGLLTEDKTEGLSSLNRRGEDTASGGGRGRGSRGDGLLLRVGKDRQQKHQGLVSEWGLAML